VIDRLPNQTVLHPPKGKIAKGIETNATAAGTPESDPREIVTKTNRNTSTAMFRGKTATIRFPVDHSTMAVEADTPEGTPPAPAITHSTATPFRSETGPRPTDVPIPVTRARPETFGVVVGRIRCTTVAGTIQPHSAIHTGHRGVAGFRAATGIDRGVLPTRKRIATTTGDTRGKNHPAARTAKKGVPVLRNRRTNQPTNEQIPLR